MDKFQAKKLASLKKLAIATQAGLVDKAIEPLLDRLNSSSNYYTTSSCAGRISLTRATEGKAKSVWFFKSHSVVKINELWNALQRAIKNYSSIIEFKMEPVILHAGCRDLASAARLVKLARLSGWSESGIIETEKRFMVELRSTENMLCPIVNKNKISVSKEHAALIIMEANKRLKNTQKKLARLLEMLNNF